jgi:hypothetical protein
MNLREGTMDCLVDQTIWLKEYSVRYSGLDFYARMTVIRLSDGKVMLHSPSPIDNDTKIEIDAIGEVAYIVAPGSYHYFHVPAAQELYPEAETYICPGIERKCPDMEFDWFLGNRPPTIWESEFEQVLVRGTRFIWEVAFLHKASDTLILVDLIENIGDQTDGAGWGIKIWWKIVFHMWNKAKPAPEYQLGWKDKKAAKSSLEKIMSWDFDKIIISHGDLILNNAKEIALKAWSTPLKSS